MHFWGCAVERGLVCHEFGEDGAHWHWVTQSPLGGLVRLPGILLAGKDGRLTLCSAQFGADTHPCHLSTPGCKFEVRVRK